MNDYTQNTDIVDCPCCNERIPNDGCLDGIDIDVNDWTERVTTLANVYAEVYPENTTETNMIKSAFVVCLHIAKEMMVSRQEELLKQDPLHFALKRKPTCVYFIQAISGGPIKIGVTTNIVRRVKALQTHEPLRVLATVQGEEALERDLHKRFASYRKEGEWFEPAEELLEYIREVANGNNSNHS